MKKLLLLIVLFVLVSSVRLLSEVTVLPAGTILSLPGQESSTLSTTQFMLSRSDMEAATLALEERDLLREELKQKKLNAILIPIGSGLLGILLGFFISRLSQ